MGWEGRAQPAPVAARTRVGSRSARGVGRGSGPARGKSPRGRSRGLQTLIQRFRKQSVPAARLVRTAPESCATARVYSRALPVPGLFSASGVGAAGTRVPGTEGTTATRTWSPVTCGARPAAPPRRRPRGGPKKKSWRFFPNPRRGTDTIKSRGDPRLRTARARAAGPSRAALAEAIGGGGGGGGGLHQKFPFANRTALITFPRLAGGSSASPPRRG